MISAVANFMHEIDSQYEPEEDIEATARFFGITVEELKERRIQRILSERVLPKPLTPQEREEAQFASGFALLSIGFTLKKDGALRRKAVNNRLKEFDLSKLRDENPVITVLDRSMNPELERTEIFQFISGRVMAEQQFYDSRLDFQYEANYDDLIALTEEIRNSIPLSTTAEVA